MLQTFDNVTETVAGLASAVTTTNGEQYPGNVAYCSGYAWWPNYWPMVHEDRTAKAFRVVKVLMDQKIVSVKTIKQFVDLVDEIVKVL